MKIHINKDEFVKSNSLPLKSDVECIFSIHSNFGLEGQLLKLSKQNELTQSDGLNILLGRLACISEEWNYKNFDEEAWANIYSPKGNLSENILKNFEQSTHSEFIERISEFQRHFVEAKFKKSSTSININPI